MCTARRPLALLMIALMLLSPGGTMSETTINQSSAGHGQLICQDGIVYHLEHHATLFGKHSCLFRYENHSPSRVAWLPDTVEFSGIYHNAILLDSVKTSLLEFNPLGRRFQLFDPSTRTFQALPDPLEAFQNAHGKCIIQTIDNTLFVKDDAQLYSYSPDQDALTLVLDAIDYAAYYPDSIYVSASEKHYYVYGTDGNVRIIEVNERFPSPSVRMPYTDDLYYCLNHGGGFELHRMNLISHSDVMLGEADACKAEEMVISMDHTGEYLYFMVKNDAGGCSLKRFDLGSQQIDASFDYLIRETQNAMYRYAKEILVTGSELYMVFAHNRLNSRDTFTSFLVDSFASPE